MDIWYPYTQMKTAPQPIVIKEAKGLYLYDDQGKSYMDAISSWWVNLHGHAHPHIVEKISEQAQILEHVIFAGFTHKPALELAKRLLQILPQELSKVFYSDNGATSVEIALKMALQHFSNRKQDKNLIIGFKHSFHGETFGAMSASGKHSLNKPFWNHLFEVITIDSPVSPKFSLQKFKALLRTQKIAGFIYEPLILGVGGMKIYPAEPLVEMITLCKQAGVVTIADEVMTGFGRTGSLFASPFSPDIMCLSKGLTGGFLPLGATVCTQEIFESFYHEQLSKAFLHGHSYSGNPLACQSALGSMDLLLTDECTLQRKMIASSHLKFCNLWGNHPKLKRIESLGTILVLEFKTTKSSYFQPIRDILYSYFLERGVLLRPLGNVLYVMPPYCITHEELSQIYAHIEEFLCSDIF